MEDEDCEENEELRVGLVLLVTSYDKAPWLYDKLLGAPQASAPSSLTGPMYGKKGKDEKF